MSDHLSPWADIVGSCFTVRSFARATGTTEGAVQTAAVELSVLALTTADGVELFPSFQVRNGRVVPHLQPILEALRRGIDDPWTWAQWLNTDMPDEARHIDDLWEGKVELTLTHAKHVAWAWAR